MARAGDAEHTAQDRAWRRDRAGIAGAVSAKAGRDWVIDLQSRHPRGSHRAGQIRAVRFAIFRRAGDGMKGTLRQTLRTRFGALEIIVDDVRPDQVVQR